MPYREDWKEKVDSRISNNADFIVSLDKAIDFINDDILEIKEGMSNPVARFPKVTSALVVLSFVSMWVSALLYYNNLSAFGLAAALSVPFLLITAPVAYLFEQGPS